VCRLRLLNICSSCGPGKSFHAERKLAAQRRLFGGNTCSILDCANTSGVEYCTRDCNRFPCSTFEIGPYPFSQGFLDMQERRRKGRAPALTPNKTPVEVPPEYWQQLQKRDLSALCSITQVVPQSSHGVTFRFLNEDVLVDIENKQLRRWRDGQWNAADDPMLELLTLLYLTGAEVPPSTVNEMVGVKDLKEAHYFSGPHALELEPLLERYGNDLKGFQQAAERLDGRSMDMADAAYMLLPFPRAPLYYLLWEGDEEFRPRLTILFDRSIEHYFSASAIWMLTGMVSRLLLQGPSPGPKITN
jgi:hypothetical protein